MNSYGKARPDNDARPHKIVLGISLVIAAALAISIQDVVFKLISNELTLWQIFTLRGVLAVPALIFISRLRGTHKSIVSAAFSIWPVLRSLFITITFLAFYAALPFLSLSTVGAANYIAPIFVTLLSAYLLKESVGPLRSFGVVIGFVGVVVLLRPGTDAFSFWALLPVAGAAFYALSHITTRAKCQNVPLAAMALTLNLVMLLAGLTASVLLLWVQPHGEIVDSYPYLFGAWSAIELQDWLVLVLLAVFAIAIGMMLAGAYQAAPPSIIATFEYSYLIFVATWDVLFFGITPTAATISGMILIVIAGLVVLHRRPD